MKEVYLFFFLQCQLLHFLWPTELEAQRQRHHVEFVLVPGNVFPVPKLCASTGNASNMTQKDINTTSWNKEKDTGDTENGSNKNQNLDVKSRVVGWRLLEHETSWHIKEGGLPTASALVAKANASRTRRNLKFTPPPPKKKKKARTHKATTRTPQSFFVFFSQALFFFLNCRNFIRVVHQYGMRWKKCTHAHI